MPSQGGAGGQQLFLTPYNYGIVQEDLYRSGLPSELNFPYLETLGLKTMVFLSNDPPPERLRKFLEKYNTTVIRPQGWLEKPLCFSEPLAPEGVVSALKVILSREHYPVIVTCTMGRHACGTLIGCLRKIQRWSLTSVFEEYRRHAGDKVSLAHEQFIELFDPRRVPVPQNPPSWLSEASMRLLQPALTRDVEIEQLPG